MRMSTLPCRKAPVRSALIAANGTALFSTDARPDGCESALLIVSLAALQAKLLMSVPRIKASVRPRIVWHCAATKARTTPDPVPISQIRGGLDPENLPPRNAASPAEDRVSISRYESSAGSYMRSKSTCNVVGVGSMPRLLTTNLACVMLIPEVGSAELRRWS